MTRNRFGLACAFVVANLAVTALIAANWSGAQAPPGPPAYPGSASGGTGDGVAPEAPTPEEPAEEAEEPEQPAEEGTDEKPDDPSPPPSPSVSTAASPTPAPAAVPTPAPAPAPAAPTPTPAPQEPPPPPPEPPQPPHAGFCMPEPVLRPDGTRGRFVELEHDQVEKDERWKDAVPAVKGEDGYSCPEPPTPPTPAPPPPPASTGSITVTTPGYTGRVSFRLNIAYRLNGETRHPNPSQVRVWNNSTVTFAIPGGATYVKVKANGAKRWRQVATSSKWRWTFTSTLKDAG